MSPREAAELIHASYQGPSWHGPSVMEALSGVTPEQASHSRSGAHTIWRLVLHCTTWAYCAFQAVHGIDYGEVTPEADFPPLPPLTDGHWRESLRLLHDTESQLVEAVRALPETRLDQLAPGKDYTLGFLLSGLASHNVYHAGQISMLRKLA